MTEEFQVPAPDLTELRWLFKETIEGLTDPSMSQMALMVRGIARAYLRGRGVKMGNYQGIKAHSEKLSELVMEIMTGVGGPAGTEGWEAFRSMVENEMAKDAENG